MTENQSDGEEAPDVHRFRVRGLRQAVGNLLVEGVENQEGRQCHHDAQVRALVAAEQRRIADDDEHEDGEVRGGHVEPKPPEEGHLDHRNAMEVNHLDAGSQGAHFVLCKKSL